MRFDKKIIPERNINGNGWKQDEEDGKIIPVWYEGRWLLFDVHVDGDFEENCIFLFILGSQLPEFRKETSKKSVNEKKQTMKFRI